jgi:hypothetical protein
MCSLCAALGGSRFWADAAGHEAFSRDGGKLSIRAEREERVHLLGRIAAFYGVSIRDWGGSSYMLETESGQRANVYTLSGIWSQLEELSDQLCDPLDPALLGYLGAAPGTGRREP